MSTEIVKPEATALFNLLIDAEKTIYTQSFETDLDGWTYGAPSTVVDRITEGGLGGAPPHTGLWTFIVESVGDHSVARRTFTGLDIGRSYTVTAWGAVDQDDLRVIRIGVTGIGFPELDTNISSTDWYWYETSYTFTATATTHEIYLESEGDHFWEYSYWDDVTVVAHDFFDPDVSLQISEGKVTLDDSWSPYVQATFNVPVTEETIVEQIDPRSNQRVKLNVSEQLGVSERLLNLGLRSRTVDHAGGNIALELASDEALLIDKKRIDSADDKTPLDYQTSLRDICDWALAKIGAALEPGTDDADLTAAWPRENLFPDPSLATAALISAATGASNVVSSATKGSAPGTRGSAAIRWTVASGDSNIVIGNGTDFISVEPGHTYTVSAYLNTDSGTFNNAYIVQRFYSAQGKLLRTVSGTGINVENGFWKRCFVTGRAPRNAAYMHPYVTTKNNTLNNHHFIDGILIEEDPEMLPWFDGGITNTALYTYTWEDGANDSASVATPVVERPRTLFYWKPGMSLWEFLEPLIQAAGLRLFCDGEQTWRLVDPETYSVPGTITVAQQVNAVKGEDTIDRNIEDLWADGVVVAYRWTDVYGNEREEYDIAGAGGKVLTINYDREYPGPGAAAAVLARLEGRGRSQDVTRLVDYTAAPGMGVTISLPGTADQTGTISQVVFDLAPGLMDLRTRDLTETI